MRSIHMRTVHIISSCIILLLVITACAGSQTTDSSPSESAETVSNGEETAATDEENEGAADNEDTPAVSELDEASPTPAEVEDDTSAADENADHGGDGRERNKPGGFAFTPIEGWDMQSLELFDGGATILMPADSDVDIPEAGINIFAGPIESASLFLGDIEADASIEEWFDVFASDVESGGNATVSEPQEVAIDDIDGLMADMSSSEEDLGEMQGRVVIARIDDERLFQMVGFGTAGHWDAETFDALLESITFFEPVLPDQPSIPELDMNDFIPGETDAVTPSDVITPTLQTP